MLSVFSDFIFIRNWRVDFLLLAFSSCVIEKTSNWLSFFTVFTVILRRAATTTTDIMILFLICSVLNLADASFTKAARCCFVSQIGGRIWSSLVHTDYSDRVVDCCWLDRCFSCKLLNISTHCLFWFSMTLSLVIHEYLNSRAIHNEVLFLSSS